MEVSTLTTIFLIIIGLASAKASILQLPSPATASATASSQSSAFASVLSVLPLVPQILPSPPLCVNCPANCQCPVCGYNGYCYKTFDSSAELDRYNTVRPAGSRKFILKDSCSCETLGCTPKCADNCVCNQVCPCECSPRCADNGECYREFSNGCEMDKYNCMHPLDVFDRFNSCKCDYPASKMCPK